MGEKKRFSWEKNGRIDVDDIVVFVKYTGHLEEV